MLRVRQEPAARALVPVKGNPIWRRSTSFPGGLHECVYSVEDRPNLLALLVLTPLDAIELGVDLFPRGEKMPQADESAHNGNVLLGWRAGCALVHL